MRVLVVAGASGGHIFPACSFIASLKEARPDIEVLLVLPKTNFAGHLAAKGYKIRYIATSSMPQRLDFKVFSALFNFMKGTLQSLFLLSGFCPEIVVGFGSLSSVALVIWAWLFRIKTLIHEQNVIPGTANTLLAMFADSIALSFPETGRYFQNYAKKIQITGNPLRKELEIVDRGRAIGFFKLAADKFTILLTGGSQGSRNLNNGFLRAVSGLKDRSVVQIIHLAGSKDCASLKDNYAGLGIEARVFDFLDKMHYAYSASDILISRAGATTISEAIFFQMPAIIVPYPFAHQHQLKNADVLKNRGCAVVVNDDELDTDKLKNTLRDFIDNPGKIKHMRANYGSMPRLESGMLLAGQALSLIA